MVGTRRALLGAGAVALLAGCGPPDEPDADPGAVLSEQLRLTEAVVVAYTGVAGEGHANATARLERIAAALRRDVPDLPAGETGIDAALEAETAALRGHVAAVGELPRHRDLLATLIADAAAGQAALLARLDRPPLPTAFPGQP